METLINKYTLALLLTVALTVCAYIVFFVGAWINKAGALGWAGLAVGIFIALCWFLNDPVEMRFG